MDTRMAKYIMEINSLQTLGAVQTFASQQTNSTLFTELLNEMLDESSVTEMLSSSASSLLGSVVQHGSTAFSTSAGSLSVNGQRIEEVTSSLGKLSGNERYADLIQKAAAAFNVPERLISAVIKQESNFNHTAVSHAGAAGLMQLMPGTAKFLGVKDLFDPEQNIMGGAKYLRQMLDQFDNNVELALAAYNAGPGNVRKYNGIPPFKETRQYVQNILTTLT